MSTNLPPELEQLAQEQIDGTNFTNLNEVLIAAMKLFKQYRSHQELRADLQHGFDEVQAGHYTEVQQDGLRTFFDSIIARGDQELAGH